MPPPSAVQDSPARLRLKATEEVSEMVSPSNENGMRMVGHLYSVGVTASVLGP